MSSVAELPKTSISWVIFEIYTSEDEVRIIYFSRLLFERF